MSQPKNRLSIAFLYDDTLDSSDGVAQQVKTLGSWFSAQGHDVAYLVGETKATKYAGGPVYSLAKNIGVVFNGNKMSVPLRASRRLIDDTLASLKPDVIHVQAPFSPLMAGKVIKRAPRSTAVIGTFHIYPSSATAALGSKLLRLAIVKPLKRLDVAVSVSSAAAELAKEAFGINSRIIPNTVNVKAFSAARGARAKKDGHHIVFLGRLVKRKGCMHLLQAFERLLPIVPGASLTIAGDGPQRAQLEKFTRSKGLVSKVKFAGFVPEEDKPTLLASADIACFPSLYGESFGIVLIEAMAAGAGVVIGGGNPGYATVLGAKKELLFDPTDTDGLTARLAELLTDRSRAAKLHEWQVSEVKKYDVAVVGAQLEELYRRAIAKRGKTRHN